MVFGNFKSKRLCGCITLARVTTTETKTPTAGWIRCPHAFQVRLGSDGINSKMPMNKFKIRKSLIFSLIIKVFSLEIIVKKFPR